MNLNELVEYLDTTLGVADIPDYPTAHNGLQVENSGEVTSIAACVDATEASIKAAIDRRADLMIVHHGLFWDGVPTVTGRRFRKIRLLLDNNVAVYSAHLPLDVHPEFGNNSQLARALGVDVRGMFGNFKGQGMGVHGTLKISREALTARLDDLLGVRVRMIPGGKETMTTVGIVTGGAGSMIAAAAAAGLDAFITGEGSHHTYFDAMEMGINVYYAGHYATETFGVRALAEHVSKRCNLPWQFLDLPTGM